MRLRTVFYAAFSLLLMACSGNEVSLNGKWDVIVDPYETGYYGYQLKLHSVRSIYFSDKSFYDDKTKLVEYDFDRAEKLMVPGIWNTQNPKYRYYKGTMWYRKLFNASKPENHRAWLCFDEVDRDAIVALNGKQIGSHSGAGSPFCFDVTELLVDGENSIVVKVDNGRNLSWTGPDPDQSGSKGGITGDVRIVYVPFDEEFYFPGAQCLRDNGLAVDAVMLIGNIPSRDKVSLDGEWSAMINPARELEASGGYDRLLKVPGDWNTQYDDMYIYEGKVWYRRTFDFQPQEGRRQFLHFGAVNYECEVGLNGELVARHEGGYTPFDIEVTDFLKEGTNELTVIVDNTRRRDAVPTVNSDWWNYGGITRSVELVSVPSTFVRNFIVMLDGNAPSEGAGNISVEVELDGEDVAFRQVSISIPELDVIQKAVTDDAGYAKLSFKASPERWCPENPKLYDVSVSAASDVLSDRIGFRTISVKGDKILLNGSPVFLRGCAVHEESIADNPERVNTREEVEALLDVAQEMNCNFLRLAHYPHNEMMVRIAEERGIMVWDEIPCYWSIEWGNPATYANTQQQLVDMIGRDINRANVIIWSVANETPRCPERLEFLRKLVEKCRELDPTRLVSAAMEKRYIDREAGLLTMDDELLDYADIISFNQYVGWYDGTSDKCDKVVWQFPMLKPVLVTEFGGGAVAGNHGPDTERFTEEYMEKLYVKNLEMFSRMPQFSGLCPWVLKDFRSPKRHLAGIQDDYNRKGLISEKGERKKAFYVMQEYYKNLK